MQPTDKALKDAGIREQRNVVGYIIGTPSVPEFVSRWQQEFLPNLPADFKPRPARAAKRFWNTDRPVALQYRVHHPEEQIYPEIPLLMRDYPAHLHIDILPEFQGKGYGRTLMTTFLGRLRDQGVKGVHLNMAKYNVRAGLFYQKMGFQRLPVVLDGGESGEEGVDKVCIWWCMKL